MSVFSERELAYLRGERLLGRLATVGADGMPHVVPVGWSLDETGTLVEIGGRNGAAYNMIVAITVLWATHLYNPSTGVATATGVQGLGLLFGPLTGGILAETTSLTTALLGGAFIVAVTALLAPRVDLVHGQPD
ncbi:hypothetical protein E1292_15850 [Nonomuraea deserti]|uniref:MFS transporter n=1 Tax=Nonomuraea deserti TaxID=1848322 RepID=A0A4V2YB45_9ACTN|nr:pyridoxamine 5'-phosphate oxidase family protein [Nonomuraea deserti]TDD06146.1 hypothetical protein E1292_15850 [Nonomuraea deserti]